MRGIISGRFKDFIIIVTCIVSVCHDALRFHQGLPISMILALLANVPATLLDRRLFGAFDSGLTRFNWPRVSIRSYRLAVIHSLLIRTKVRRDHWTFTLDRIFAGDSTLHIETGRSLLETLIQQHVQVRPQRPDRCRSTFCLQSSRIESFLTDYKTAPSRDRMNRN